jgi:hypothetical protein
VYDQLPPGVLAELQRLNPRTPKGHRKHKHHQHLTADTGHPALDRQIVKVVTIMSLSDDNRQFKRLFEKAHPGPQQRLPLVIDPPEDG